MRVGRRVQRPDQRLEGHPERLEQARGAAGRALGVGDRVDLRHLLADRDVQRGGDEVGDAERDRQGRRRAGSVSPSGVLEQAGDGRLAHEADAQRGHRDAELAGRQVLVDALELQRRRAGRPSAPSSSICWS